MPLLVSAASESNVCKPSRKRTAAAVFTETILDNKTTACKRRKLARHASSPALPINDAVVQNAVLDRYFDHVVTLRTWLLQQDFSASRKRRIAAFGTRHQHRSVDSKESKDAAQLDKEIATILDTHLVACDRKDQASSRLTLSHLTYDSQKIDKHTAQQQQAHHERHLGFLQFSQLASTSSSDRTEENDVHFTHAMVKCALHLVELP